MVERARQTAADLDVEVDADVDRPADAATVDRHWRLSRQIVAPLLAAWFFVSFVALYFARELSVDVADWPLSFWIAAQGSLFVYLALVWWYVMAMRRLDAGCGLADEP